MHSTSSYNSKSHARGFTLVEVLIVAPIVILAISVFIGIMITIVGDVLQSRAASQQVYDSTSALDIIEQDLRLTSNFATTTGTLPTPQGSNNNFNGTAAFTSPNNALILETAATDQNPASANVWTVYYANQPNACTSATISANPDIIYNRVFHVTNIYFVKDGSLWRRTYVPTFNTNISSPDANTVCTSTNFGPWQRNSCSPGQTATRCQTQDVKLVDNVTGFDVEYHNSDDPNPDQGPNFAPEAEAISVTITTNQQSVGEANETVMSRQMARGNTTTPVQWRPLALQNGWGRFNIEYGDPSYTITNTGVVFLRGFITPSTPTPVNGTIIATLPVGYRPSQHLIFPTSTGPNTSGRIDVRPDGTVRFVSGSTTSWSTLDDIHFLADIPPYTLSDLPLTSGWTHFAPDRHLQAGVDGAGRTHVRGIVNPGTTTSDTTIATFPTAMQAEAKTYFFSGVGGGEPYTYYAIRSNLLRFRFPATASWLAVQNMFYPSSFTGWSDLTLGTGWAPYSTTYPDPQYTKSSDGVVTVRGLVKDGSTASGTVIGTLPPEYRPGSVRSFNVPSYNTQYARVNVLPDGRIIVRELPSSSWLSLNGITFIAGY